MESALTVPVMHKGTAARQTVVAESGFNDMFLRRNRRRWQGFRIEDLGKDTYAVRSPGSERRRTVKLADSGWSCTCPRVQYRKSHCRHSKAVECVRFLPKPKLKEPVVLDPVPENTCTHCGADGATKAGVRKNKNYRNQIYKCRSCKRRFSANFGFEKLSFPPEIVVQAIYDYYGGKSTTVIADDLKDRLDHHPSQQTVSNWVRSFSALAGIFARSLDPCVGEKWRGDGMFVKVNGKPMYLHMMIDSLTRFWLSYVLTPNKTSDDVAPMYRDAKLMAGWAPTLLVTDADQTYHHSHVHARWDINNNKMERFNGTMRAVLNRMRGFKDAESPLLEGMRVHYNHVRPHSGIGKLTPGEAAGIKVNGWKWKTIIQRARLFQKKNG